MFRKNNPFCRRNRSRRQEQACTDDPACPQYHHGHHARHGEHGTGETTIDQTAFPLMLAADGEAVTIIEVKGKCALQERLISMGINAGDELKVIQKQGHGAMLIEAHGSRYTLGGGMAHNIKVIRCK